MKMFGSMFNPERVSGGFSELGNPERDIEGLRKEAERPKDFPAFPNESIGRSQVKPKKLPPIYPKALELTDSDEAFLSDLNCKTYGFNQDNNEFWMHSVKRVPGGRPNMTIADGKIREGSSPEKFVENLIDNDTQAFKITGKDKYGAKKIIAVVKNSETGIMTMYTCDSKQCYPLVINCDDNKLLASSIIDNLSAVDGATVWTK